MEACDSRILTALFRVRGLRRQFLCTMVSTNGLRWDTNCMVPADMSAKHAAAEFASRTTTSRPTRFEWHADFQLLRHFGSDPINRLSDRPEFTTGKLWYLEDGVYYTSLWAEGGHPHGTMDLGAYARVEHWAVRRWVSTTSGLVNISGHAGKTMPWGENWGGRCQGAYRRRRCDRVYHRYRRWRLRVLSARHGSIRLAGRFPHWSRIGCRSHKVYRHHSGRVRRTIVEHREQ